MGRHKSGYVQQSMKVRSRPENDTDIAEMISVGLCQVSSQKVV